MTTIMQTTMKPIRKVADLEAPPETFTTKASETVNSIIKAHVSYKPGQIMKSTSTSDDLIHACSSSSQ